jgi:hypothetical protein
VKNSINLNLDPIDQNIEKLRKKIGTFLKSHDISDEAIHSQFKVIRGLIKTGIKYSNFSPADNKIMVTVEVEENIITAVINNPINETGFDRLKELEQTIQFIQGYQDPFEALTIAQKEAFIYSSHKHSNALDLSRIAYEENVILDFFVNENNVLQLSAIKRIDEYCCNISHF